MEKVRLNITQKEFKQLSKTTNVYDKVTQKLDEFNFTHNNIKLATDIDISM